MIDSNRAQHKIAVFVTRQTSAGIEIVLTWHTGGGGQLPAGTVEPGESFEDAAIREVREETGVEDVELVNDLGSITLTMPEPRALLLDTVRLRFVPDGPETRWELSRVAVDVIKRDGEWALIKFAERDVEDPNSLVIAELTGWVRAASLTRTQERRFFHAVSKDSRSDSWAQEAEPGMIFTVAWHPLHARPPLIPGHEEWLARFRDSLILGP